MQIGGLGDDGAEQDAVKPTLSWEIKQLWLFAGSSYDSESLDLVLLLQDAYSD